MIDRLAAWISVGSRRLESALIPGPGPRGLGGDTLHDDVIKWKHFPRYWPFVRGIHRSPVNSPHKGHWRGALIFVYLRLNKRLSKQSRRWWFETPSCPLWRQCNVGGGHKAGAPFTNDFSIVIRIRWKLHSTLLWVVVMWSLRNFAHSTTAMLSWHVHNFVAICHLTMELPSGQISIEF